MSSLMLRPLALACAALLVGASASAQIGVVDQDNTSHDNVGWNMGFYTDMQQEIAVGINGQFVGVTIQLGSTNLATGLPVAIFRGYGPHASSATPVWSGIAYATSTTTMTDVYVDCSIANLQVTTSDVLTIRCGDATTPRAGVSLTGNYGSGMAFYAPNFYEQGVNAFPYRLYFKSHVLACASGWLGKYGAGCSGSAGHVPDLTVGGCARRNAPVSVQVTKGLGYSVGVLLFGTGQINVPIGGTCELWIVPFLPVQLPIALSPGPAGTGSATLNGTLPPLPGQSFTMQALIYDPGTPVRMSATNAVVVNIG